MGIVGFALRYRHTFYVLALMMLFLGGSAIRTTPKDIFPNINIPVVSVIRTLDNVLATPHIGYVSHGLYKTFYEDTVSNIRRWLDTHWASVA
jgi:lactate dehydrogenase-like 2-hydroxyacid dehydrogenase